MTEDYRIGIEEEYFIVDTETKSALRRTPMAFMDAAKQGLGDAVYVDLGGGKNLVALLAHIDKNLELEGINYVALRAYTAAVAALALIEAARPAR